MNENIKNFRQEIATAESEQRNTKAQRKTVYYTGERTMTPQEAYWKAINNADELRVMYAAYGLMRGRKFAQIENHWEGGCHPLVGYAERINKYLNKYGYTMEYEEKESKFWGKYKVFKENCDETVIRLGEQEA